MSDAATENEAPDAKAKRLTREIGAMYVAALLLILGCVLLASAVPFVAQNLYALVAAVFVGLPYWWLGRKKLDFDRFGLTWDNAGRGALWGLLFTALTLGPFAVGYWWWETSVQNREYRFAVDNFFKWPVEFEGRPTGWGDNAGVWVWSDGPALHVGLRADKDPVEVAIEAGQAFRPRVIGTAKLSAPEGKDPLGEHRRWTVRLDEAHKRTEVVVGGEAKRAPPRDIRISARRPGSDKSVTIHQGRAAEPVGASVDLDRGLLWIVLWLMTQLVFIALPEEFFYRGYLQTRLKEILQARKEAKSDGEGAERRRILGISGENLVTSVLFSLGHLLIPIGGAIVVARASVFFPSLVFGWLRERTDTIAASVVYHAGANLMVLLAAPHFF